MPYDPTYHLLWRPDKIRESVAAEQPDVLEIHSPYVAAIGALASARSTFGVRTFVWHSDFIDTYQRVLIEPRPRLRALGEAVALPLWAWVRTIARACSATFVASAWQRRKLAEHGVEATHLPFGVDKDVFRPVVTHHRTDALVLVASGRLAIEKRWDVVIDAFARIAARRPNAELTIFGDGPERARLEEAAKRDGMGRVRFAGFERDQKKLARALGSADALVHACPHETFGIAVAEAIACGLPIVVPDEGGAAELARPEFAETYRQGDAAACEAAIERLIARDRETVRSAAITASQSILSTRQHFERLLAHYAELLLLHA